MGSQKSRCHKFRFLVGSQEGDKSVTNFKKEKKFFSSIKKCYKINYKVDDKPQSIVGPSIRDTRGNNVYCGNAFPGSRICLSHFQPIVATRKSGFSIARCTNL